MNAKKSMLSEQAVKSWPLEKYAKFVAPKETSSTHKQGYWKVCMLRIVKSIKEFAMPAARMWLKHKDTVIKPVK